MLPKASPYVQQYVAYLRDRHWDLVGHLTFPFEVTERRAGDLWHKFVHLINRQQYGNRYYKHRKQASKRAGVSWARATELQTRGAIHYHFLIDGIKRDMSITIPKAQQAWRKLTGGNEHSITVLPYNPALGGVEYMCKHIDTFNRPLELGGDTPTLHLQS
jgi:hypothetical protein